MTPLNYITLPTAILRLKDLNLRQKLLLGLIISFNEKGLKMTNKALGEILDVWPSRVSKLLKEMESKGYVRIENKQSQYRKIYLLQSAKVDNILLATKRNSKSGALATKRPSTIAQSRHLIKRNKDAAAAHTQKPMYSEPPTIKQVKDYSTTRGFPDFDAKHFVEWYAAADWRHKDGKPVLNWKQTVLTWLRRDQAKEQQAQAAKPAPKRGDPDWLPDEQEAERIFNEAGITK
jgi:DNA-binding MarR family transcriptional regulator